MGVRGFDCTDSLGTHSYLYVSVPYMRVVECVFLLGGVGGVGAVRQASSGVLGPCALEATGQAFGSMWS